MFIKRVINNAVSLDFREQMLFIVYLSGERKAPSGGPRLGRRSVPVTA